MRLVIWSLLGAVACGKAADTDESGSSDALADAGSSDGVGDGDGSTPQDADGSSGDGGTDGSSPEDPGDGHRVRCFEWVVAVPAEGGSMLIDRASCVAEVGSAMKIGARPDCAIQDAANFDPSSGSGWTEVDVWPSGKEMSDALGTTDCAADEPLPGGVNCYTWSDAAGGSSAVTERAACITLAEGSLVAGARPTCATQELLNFNAEVGGNWASVDTWPTGREMWEVSGTTDCAAGAALPSDVECFTWEETIPVPDAAPMVFERAACVVLHNEVILVGARPECAIQSAVEYDVGGSTGWTEVDVWPSGREMHDAGGASDCAGGQPLND